MHASVSCTYREDVDLLDAISVQLRNRDAWQIIKAPGVERDAASNLGQQQVQWQLLAKHCRSSRRVGDNNQQRKLSARTLNKRRILPAGVCFCSGRSPSRGAVTSLSLSLDPKCPAIGAAAAALITHEAKKQSPLC
jgi:hypothetical protein